MSLPSAHRLSFISNSDLTFNEQSNSAVAASIDGSYVVVAGDGTNVFRSKAGEAPTLTSISTFHANSGTTYFCEAVVRKTSQDTLGVPSWLRPGFDAYLADDFSNTSTSYVPVDGATYGEGLTSYNGFIDTSNWELNQWYTVGSSWTADQDYPYARPRMRINRKDLILPDATPYSNAIYEIKELVSEPQIALSHIKAEYGGGTPAKLSDYYRKTLLTAIVANVVDVPYTLTGMLQSESGVYETTYANGVSSFTTDGGDFGPLNDLQFGLNEGSLSLVNDPTYGQVLQSQGILWGGVVQVKAWGMVGYIKVDPSQTYTLSTTKKVVSDPTNTANSPQIYGQLWCYDSNYKYINAYNVFEFPLSSSQGWQTLSGTFTLSQIQTYLPDAVYVRGFIYDNLYAYTNQVGNYVGIVCNCVNQTASISITANSGIVNGGLGLTKIYDVSGGGDRVYVLNGNTWTIDPAQSINNLGSPRQVTNPYTKRAHRIGNFYVVDTGNTKTLPTSGQINFSDFLGTSQTAGPIWLTDRYFGQIEGNSAISLSVTAYSLSNSPIYFDHQYLPGGITNVVTFANTVTIGNSVYTANTIVFSGRSEYTLDQSYPIGINLQASDPYITIEQVFYYDVLNNPPIWSTPAGSLGSFSSGSVVSINLSAADPENYPVEYALSNGTTLPTGLFLSYTGTISGTVAASSGVYNFAVRASDGYFYTDRTFSINVI